MMGKEERERESLWKQAILALKSCTLLPCVLDHYILPPHGDSPHSYGNIAVWCQSSLDVRCLLKSIDLELGKIGPCEREDPSTVICRKGHQWCVSALHYCRSRSGRHSRVRLPARSVQRTGRSCVQMTKVTLQQKKTQTWFKNLLTMYVFYTWLCDLSCNLPPYCLYGIHAWYGPEYSLSHSAILNMLLKVQDMASMYQSRNCYIL